MRSLTGIPIVDVVEYVALAALVAYAVIPRATAIKIGAVIAFVAFAVDLGASPLASLVTGMAVAALVLVIVTDKKTRRLAVVATAAAALALLVAGGFALTIRGDARNVKTHLTSLRDDLTADDPTLATRNLATTDAELARIHSRIGNIATQPARAVPFLGKQLGAARTLIATAQDVVRTARHNITGINVHDLKLQHGHVPVDKLAALQRPARNMQRATRDAAHKGRQLQRQVLLPPLNHVADELVRQADKTQRSASLLATLAADAPDLFGNNGTRRYFLLLQNPAEARPLGGILGAYAEVSADHGQLALAAVGRDHDLNALSGDRPRNDVPGFTREARLQPTRYWQNMTASPDFPTVAAEIEREYAPIAHPLDGVFVIDPTALAAMLKVIGPVSVPNWPVPLDANNAVAVFEHDQYVQFANPVDYPKREAFMSTAVATIWSHLTGASNFSLHNGLKALGAAVDDGHVAMQATRPGEQSLFKRSGLSGAFPHDLPGDVLGVTNYNIGANKLDWFTTRKVTYTPVVSRGELTATLTITLRSNAPAGQPSYVQGPNDPDVPVGHDPQLVSVYSALELDHVTIDGATATVGFDSGFGVHIYDVTIDLPPGAQHTIVMHLSHRWRAGAPYELAYRPQALVHGDDLGVWSQGHAVQPFLTPNSYENAAIRWYRFGT